MRVPRAYFNGRLAIGERVELPQDTAHHFLRVLRLPNGASVRLFNGEPGDWHASLDRHGKNRASAEIGDFEPRATESPLDITLVQGISRGQRMDYTIEKSVELGVNRIVPVIMERTQAPPEGDRARRKERHWRGIIESAAAQSGRTYIPELETIQAFTKVLKRVAGSNTPALVLDPDGQSPTTVRDSVPGFTLVAGPEGGFSPSERTLATDRHVVAVRIGPRVLRTETAAVGAITLFQGFYGDLR